MKKNVLEYLEETVKRFPDKKAFCNEKEQLSFREFHEQAQRVGSALIQRGIKKEPVLIYMEKSPSMVMAFMGTIYSGCFYVPLDAEMPFTRIQLIIENTGSRMLICDESTREKVEQLGFGGEVRLCRELIRTDIDFCGLRAVREKQLDTDPLYVLYTSGSTGVPKGVVGHHRGVINFIDHLAEAVGFDENTVFGNQTPFYFDASMKEIYATLKCGATTWIIPKSLFMLIVQLIDYLNEHEINTICWVPSALTMLSAFGAFEEAVPKFVHTVCFGGEVFPVSQYKIWKKALPNAKYVNLYGPTEATVLSTYYIIDREFEDGEVIPLGKAFDNTEIYLIKEDGSPAKAGEPGEMYIRGTGVTHGYYNNPEKTKEAFVQNPFHSLYHETVYKTGDLAKYNDRGELVFLSRKDYQIKHMGHRIELGEIDANVETISGIRSCCTVYAKEDEKIVLFYVGDIDKKALTVALKERVPRYMIPNTIIRLEALPTTATGKMNRMEMLEIYKKEKKQSRRRSNGNS